MSEVAKYGKECLDFDQGGYNRVAKGKNIKVLISHQRIIRLRTGKSNGKWNDESLSRNFKNPKLIVFKFFVRACVCVRVHLREAEEEKERYRKLRKG